MINLEDVGFGSGSVSQLTLCLFTSFPQPSNKLILSSPTCLCSVIIQGDVYSLLHPRANWGPPFELIHTGVIHQEAPMTFYIRV